MNDTPFESPCKGHSVGTRIESVSGLVTKLEVTQVFANFSRQRHDYSGPSI